ncbi:MAG: methyltransferase domain-containing protein [Chromatiales bacterium]|jgi:SAM-dependent methyltransferase
MYTNKEFKLGSCLQKQLDAWFETRLGQTLMDQELACLQEKAAAIFGYHVVQIGLPCHGFELLKQSPARNRVILDSASTQPGIDIKGDPRFLPLASDSIDGIILPHTLDFSPDPHQLVREVERVLIPEGKVLLSGFNPWSLWGVGRLFRRRSGNMPWCSHFFMPKRVQDWFSLLGFDLEEVAYLHYRPPIHNQLVMQKLAFMEYLGRRAWPMLGGVYVMQAVKRAVTVTPIRMNRWRMKKRVLPAAARPTTRSSSRINDAIR